MRRLRTACGLVAVAAAAAVTASPAHGAGRVYWGNESASALSYANLDGSGGADLATTGAPKTGILGVAIDAATSTIYWANYAPGAGSISYASLGGNGGGMLPTTAGTVKGPFGLALDPAAGRLYWANKDGGTIAYANLNGTGGGTLSTAGATIKSPTGVAVDPAAGRIYWDNFVSGGGSISYASLDGSGHGGDLTTTGATMNGPEGLAIDPGANRLYWANYSSYHTISDARLDGTGGADLATTGATVESPTGLAIDAGAGRVYWANSTQPGGGISYASLTGGGGGDLPTGTATTADPAFPLLLEPPLGTGAPEVGGGSATGSRLQCSQGTWAPDVVESFLDRAPASFAYRWTRNGAAIAGATGGSYTAATPGNYGCQVIAANYAGSSSQTSAPHAIAAALASPRLKLAHVSQSHRRWREGNRPARTARRRRPPVGTTFSFTLNQSARVRFAFTQRVRGRRAEGRCVARARRTRHRRACARTLVRAALSFTARSGRTRVAFRGRVSRRRSLRPGLYTLIITATSRAGGHASARLTFRIVA